MTTLIALGTLAATGFLFAGLAQLARAGRRQQEVVYAVLGATATHRPGGFAAWDRRFRTTALGSRLQRELLLAGIDQPPLVAFGQAAGAGLLLAYLLWTLLAPLFSVVGVALAFSGARSFLARETARRREKFIAQMPQLARVLAGSVEAGFSITSAVAATAEEMAEPARSEFQRVAHELSLGAALHEALDGVTRRVPSREVRVLVSTLVVCARTGGSLVSALRDIAATLEQRKDARREIRTTLAQPMLTGYLVVALGFFLLFLLNRLQPGTVEKMTTRTAGQLALTVSFALFGLGLLGIRRITRIEP